MKIRYYVPYILVSVALFVVLSIILYAFPEPINSRIYIVSFIFTIGILLIRRIREVG